MKVSLLRGVHVHALMVLCRTLIRPTLPLFLCLGATHALHAATLVQEFYLPMPEQQIYQANSAIVTGTGSTISSTFSVVVTGDGTQIYYDQWEDGYETSLGSPTQGTTKIWGDGNNANGIPPGFTNDPTGLSAGTVITLTNDVALPRNPSTFLWDGRDHIASTKALVISRAGWPVNPGPVFAGAVGVLSVMDYGTNYISPVGQDLTNNLFKYVGMFLMAAQNNTSVRIDPNGNGVGVTNIVLNQGESYLVNGGIKKGGRVTATKPIQADLLIGHVGATYASDWFTLYPVEEWDDTYYTPVASASTVAQPAYVYVFNPNASAITVNYSTRSGSGSFSVAATNVFQFQMPVGSGASFVSQGGQNFFAICTVAANNASDTAYNWGLTLVPKAALTTEAAVGWGPGSAGGTVDGSPVWVTTLGNTRVYVDYKGDHSGLLVDPIGNHYDTNFDLVTLQSKKIYDPNKNQTGMRVYTVDGTLLTAAWGEDADTAAPGNPYIDAGTTVLPFPVPTLEKTAMIVTDTPPTGLSIGDVIAYSVKIDNKGLLPLGNTLVIDTPSANLLYVTNSTFWNSNAIPDSASGTAFPLDSPGFTIPVILSRGTSTFAYLCKVIGAGVVSNSVNIGGTTISSSAFLAPPGSATVSVNFSDTNGVPLGLYAVGAKVYVNMTNAVGNTASNTLQTITVTVQDTNSSDAENIILTETSTNSGIFRNIGGLSTSTTAGLVQQDGTLNVAPGDTLRVSYTDPIYGDSATNTASILVPALNKQLYLSVNGSTNGTQALNRINPVAFNHGPTRTSVDLNNGSGSGIITLASTNARTFASGLSVGITNVVVTNTANRLLLVAVSCDPSGTAGVSSMTYGGQTMSLVTSWRDGANAGNMARSELWRLLNPTAGTTNVIINFSASQGSIIAVATVFAGVDQVTPFSSTNTSDGTGTLVSNKIASAAGEQVFHFLTSRTGTAANPTGAGQVKIWGVGINGGNQTFGAGSLTPGAASVTNLWTVTGSGVWSSIAVSIKAAAGSGVGTNVTSFAQTPSLATSFTMPAGGLVSITNFITVTNGSLTANHNVTAMLQTNGVSFLTLTNPAYNESAGISTNLVWSGALTTNITVPSGTNITCVISNGVSGTAFHINYDSTNAPSVIVLPASTVIHVNSLGVYDAPYPGGSLVFTPVAGSTLYVRGDVSDPFGNYDITSLGLAITGPVPSANVATNLVDANVVATNSSSKTYEFTWHTGTATGSYGIVATANEGTEGVTNSAATSLSLIFLDLGTASTTEFTSGNNGVATNAFPAGAAGSACIRVTDLDQDTDSTTTQTVQVVVSSSTLDSEVITLAETSTNSGIFTSCLTVSTNSGNVVGDNILYAPAGSVITATYTDFSDGTDTSSATATVLPPAGVPGVKVTKTIVSPSGGRVGVGDPVIYNLQIVNVGSTTLPSMTVTDSFPSAALSFSSASLTPNVNVAGTLVWTNLGAMTPGQSTNITVTFLTLAAGTATNTAFANGSTTTNSSSVPLIITHSALNITKTLLSPTNTPVAIGSNVVFRIVVQNVGNTLISTLPLEDNYSGTYFQFISANIPPDGQGAGSLLWTNLAYPTALATNASIIIDVTMKVTGAGNPANNTAVADFAVDNFGNSVPTAAGSTNIVTAAASISGYVYEDPNQLGVFTNTDSPLSGVTVEIYTDPTGTGTPGTLVQSTTTSSGGYYELLNLGLGHYVVVASALPGYAYTVPSNGRLQFNLTNLVASTNNYFFQYQPSASLDSTFGGTVYNDLNGNGINTNQAGIAFVSMDLVQDVNSNGVADTGEPAIASTATDTSGFYSFAGVTPGRYVIRETDLYGYYSTGDSQAPNNNQVSIVTTNGITSTNNNFFDRLSPVAVNDTNTALYLVPIIISPLTNDASPNGDLLTLSNVTAIGGTVVVNPGATNLTFTPTNTGGATITYTNTDQHGGISGAVITVNVTAQADLAIGKSAVTSVLAASNIVYTISVTNLGPSGASGVVVTDALPAGVSFVNASSGGVNNGGIVSWSLGTLASNAVTSVTLTVTAPSSGSITNTALVNSPTGDPNPTNSVSPPVPTAITPVADLAIGKSAAASVFAASNLVYTISVTNFGPSAASGVVVTDALPAGVSFVNASGGGVNNSGIVSWNLGTLASNAVANLTLTVTAPSSGSITNTALVNSPTGDPNPTNSVSPPVPTAITPVADLAIGKSAAASVFASSNLVYTISVTNFGPSAASGVVVTDALPAGVSFVNASGGGVNNSGIVSWNLGTLASNAVANLTLTVTAPASGSITNTALVNSPTGDPNPTNSTSPPVTTTVIPVADLAIGKSAAASVFAASNLVYTISVTNFGPSAASGVVVTDALPAGVSFVNASGGGVNNSGIVSWNLGTLASNAVANLTLTVTAPASGSITNTALVNSPTGDPNPTNSTSPPVPTTVIPVADLAIGKSAAASVFAASNLVYTISVTNFGPSTASGVVVTDALPAGVSFVNASGGGVNNGSIVSWSLGTLASNAVTSVTLTVTAPSSGSITNTALVNSPTGDPNPTNSTSPPVPTAITPVADLAIGKSAAASVFAASNLVYTISVTNFGPSAASGVVVTDALPAGVSFVNASGGGVNNSGIVSWSLGTLASNAVANLTLTVTAPSSGSITNAALVNSPISDPNPTNSTSPPVPTTVIPVADLAIGKSAAASVFAASNLVYTISVTNFGPSTASGVVVTDALPAGVSFVNASGGGVNNGGIVSWSLGTLASNAVASVTLTVTAPSSGSITNTTLVNSPTGDPNPTNSVSPPVPTTIVPVADLAIGKSAAASVFASSNLVYTISVTNFGPSTASGVVVTDALPAGVSFVSAGGGGLNNGGIVSWNLGTLASNAVANLTLTVTAPASGSITNTALVNSPTGDPNPTNSTSPPVTTTVIPVADLAIGKSGPAGVSFNTGFSYQIVVTNFGPSDASGILVTDSLPAGLILVNASPAATTNGNNEVVWSIGSLIAGATTNLTLDVTSTLITSVTNVALVGSPISDPGPTNNGSIPVVTLITNAPPIANPDSAAVTENTVNNVLAPLVNDLVQTPGGSLTILSVNPTNGTASFIGGTNVLFTPAPDFVGTATVGYTVTDNVGGTNSAVITIIVTNIPPLANPDNATDTENVVLTLAPLANDVIQTSGGVLVLINVAPTNGTATILGGTNVLFTPATNFIGTAAIGYTITDGIGGTNSSIITITVTNIAPLANPDTATGAENTALTILPLANDAAQTPGGVLSIVAVNPATGTATILGGTNVLFTPATNFVGTTTVGYTITDNIGGTNSSVITVTVTNIAPIANPDAEGDIENVSITLAPLTNDIVQTPGGVLAIIAVAPTNGIVTILGGTNILFTPDTNFVGTATVGYTVTDNIGGTNSSVVSIVVTNIAPAVAPDNTSTVENVPVTVSPLVNDAPQTPGGVLTIISLSPTNGIASLIDGTNVLFTPATNFLGIATVGYAVTDSIGGTNRSLITITVTNIAPIANPDAEVDLENVSVTLSPLTNDVVQTPGGVLAIIALAPTNGTASIIGGTTIAFTPATNFVGTATIGYTITDGIGGTNSSVITISVANVPPVAGPDSASMTENTSLVLAPLANDAVQTPGGTLAIITVNPAAGTATILGGTNVLFTPPTNFIGTTTVDYTITDNVGGTNSSVITVTVTNIAPLANPDGTAVAENTAITLTPLTNDVVQTPGGVLAIIAVYPTNGVASIIGGTDILFTPDTNFIGAATIGYTIIDNVGGTNTSLITVLVTNIPPVANPDNYSVAENSVTNVLAPLGNDSAPTPGGSLVITSVFPTNSVAVIANGTNALFTPASNFVGVATVGYTVSDGIGGTNGSLITVTVTNIPPIANPDSVADLENTPIGLTPLANDTVQTPGGTLTILSVAPTNGVAAILGGTNVLFTPATNFIGTATIGYTITDGIGGTNTSLITVTVTNAAPGANPDSASMTENTSLTISPLVNDTAQTPGGTLTIINVSPTNGTANILGGTNVLFVPTTNFTGTATIGYTVTDGVGGTNTSLITVTVTNIPPIANPDNVSGLENIPLILAPLTNDVVRTPGGVLAILAVNPTNGTAIISGPNILFTPATNFIGTATVGYTITDGIGGTNTAVITIFVVNVPPVANPDNAAVTENTVNNVLVPLANDAVQSAGGVLSIIDVTPVNGTATILGGTNVLFTPATNFIGTATIGYTVIDNVGGTNASVITVTVTNIPPLANPDGTATLENVSLTLSPLTNDVVRTSGGVLTIVAVDPTNGTASILGGTDVLFTPATNFIGVATIGYTVTDGIGGTNHSVVTVTVTNSAPVAVPDNAAMTENTSLVVSPLANDTAPTPGATLSIISVAPTNGVAIVQGGTNVLFTPATNFIGNATVGYTIADGVGGTNTSLITITVTNIPPVANPDTASGTENVPVTVSPLVNDAAQTPGGTLTIIGLAPTNGTATISGANVLFTPATNFIGTATVGYTITDNVGGTNTSLITVTVTNIAPVANPDNAAVTENTVNDVLTPLVNDSAPTPGGTLTIIVVNPTNGTASISGNTVRFTPATNFLGTATIGYTITDGIGGTNTSLITVTVTNIPPVANPDSAGDLENTSITLSPLTNDVVRTTGGVLVITGVNPTNGVASIIGGATILFTPNTNFIGTATIGYTITDTLGGTNASVITVTVTNLAPVANPDNYAISENSGTTTLTPLANDTAPTPGGTLTILTIAPTNGTAGIQGGTNVLFTPATNFVGTATIGYTITDGIGGTNTSLITITVTNIPPVANPDAVAAPENVSLTLSPLTNDVVQTPGGSLVIISVSPTNGAASIVAGTGVLFTPATNFVGTATVGYTIIDGIGGTNRSLVTIIVTNVPPAANPDVYAVGENSVTNILRPLTNDVVQTPGGSLTILSVSPTNGVAVIQGGTNILFTPATNFLGTATIGYTVIDNVGGTNRSLVTITVTNRPPVANPDTVTTFENLPTTLSPLTNDIALTPGGVLAIIAVNPTNGTATISGTNVLFTPSTNFFGTATVGYTITDGLGGTNTSLVTVTVLSAPPTANAQSVSVTENTSKTITLAGSDPNSLPLSFAIVTGPANGVLGLLNTNTGSVTYTPNANYAGPDSFTFRVNDAVTNSTPATVSITVLPATDLIVFKAGPTNGIAGSNLVYTITVTNSGPNTATNVAVFDQLPAGFTLVSAVPSASVSASNLVSWPVIGTLAKNARTNYTVTVVSAEGGNLTNIAFVTSTTLDPNPTNSNGTATNSRVTTVVTPLADVAIFKSGNTNVQAGGTVTYTITATNSGPSTALNVVVRDTLPGVVTFQTASGGYSLSNNIVTWTLASLAKGASSTFNISVTAPGGGSFVNTASGTSDTPDSNTNNNNGTAAGSQVSTTVAPIADVQVLLFGPTNVTVGDGFSYTMVVSNAGPSTAANITMRDALPTNLVFSSATGGGTLSNGIVVWPLLSSLASGGFTNLTVNVSSTSITNRIGSTANKYNFLETNTVTIAGLLTNVASAFATTFDPNLTNNNGTAPSAQVRTVVLPAEFSVLLETNNYPANTVLTNTIIPLGGNLFAVGTSAFNPQTGLYEESVTITNIGTTVVHALRLYVGGLRSGVKLYNATGTNNGVPYVEYDPPYNSPLLPYPAYTNNTSVTFLLEFFVPDRRPFTNSLSAVAINSPVIAQPVGTPVVITRSFMDTRATDPRYVIEFTSIPGRTYTILYGPDVGSITNIAVPSVVAAANVTQWYDDGPPETISKPTSVSSRYYRVVQQP